LLSGDFPMGATEIQKIVCPGCSALLSVRDNYCRCCGAPLSNRIGDAAGVRPVPSAPHAPTEVVLHRAGDLPRASDSRAVVLLMLFFVLGPFALPMLWRSRGFSPQWKAVLSAVVIGVTAILFFLLWFVIAKTLEPLSRLTSLEGF
jgi:hypothetical protein